MRVPTTSPSSGQRQQDTRSCRQGLRPTQNSRRSTSFASFATRPHAARDGWIAAGGKQVWVLAKLGKMFTLPGVTRSRVLLFSSPHCWEKSRHQVRHHPLVCMNTFTMAMNEAKYGKDSACRTFARSTPKLRRRRRSPWASRTSCSKDSRRRRTSSPRRRSTPTSWSLHRGRLSAGARGRTVRQVFYKPPRQAGRDAPRSDLTKVDASSSSAPPTMS